MTVANCRVPEFRHLIDALPPRVLGRPTVVARGSTRSSKAGVRRLIYLYDFGDDWEHVVTVEDLVPPDPNQPPIVCFAGANACPPEDVGGSHAYAAFRNILAEIHHEEHADMLAWAGGAFNPTAFHLQATTNEILKTIRP